MGKTVAWLAFGVVALIVVGMVFVKVFGAVLKLGFYLVVGAAVVGGGLYLVGRARAALRSGRSREIR